MSLPQRVDRTPVVGIHRVQRLDGKTDPGLCSGWQDRGDSLRNLFTGFGQGLPGNGSADEHHQRCPECVGLLDRQKVVVHRPLAGSSVRCRKKTAPAQRDHLQTGLPCLACHLRKMPVFERLPPDGDAADTSSWKLYQTVFQRELLGGDGMNAKARFGSSVGREKRRRRVHPPK